MALGARPGQLTGLVLTETALADRACRKASPYRQLLVIMERPAADSQMSRVTLRRGESSGAEPHTKGTGRSCLKYCLLVWMSMPRRLPWRSPNKPVKYVR